MLIGEHHAGVTDFQFGVSDPAVRTDQSHHLGRFEHLNVVVNRLRRTFDDQVRCDTVVSVRDRFGGHRRLTVLGMEFRVMRSVSTHASGVEVPGTSTCFTSRAEDSVIHRH